MGVRGCWVDDQWLRPGVLLELRLGNFEARASGVSCGHTWRALYVRHNDKLVGSSRFGDSKSVMIVVWIGLDDFGHTYYIVHGTIK